MGCFKSQRYKEVKHCDLLGGGEVGEISLNIIEVTNVDEIRPRIKLGSRARSVRAV